MDNGQLKYSYLDNGQLKYSYLDNGQLKYSKLWTVFPNAIFTKVITHCHSDGGWSRHYEILWFEDGINIINYYRKSKRVHVYNFDSTDYLIESKLCTWELL